MSEPMSDDFRKALLQMLMIRGFTGESEIKEHINWDVQTRGKVPLVQAFTGMVGIFCILVGLFLLGGQVGVLTGLDLTPADYLFAAVLGLTAFLVVMGLLYRAMRSATQGTVAILAAGLALILVLAMISAVAGAAERFTIWRGLASALGIVLLLPGLALAYRQLVDLIDPFGKTSPMERMMVPYLAHLFIGEPIAPAPPARLIPRRVAGQLTDAVSYAPEVDHYDIAREDLDFVAFIAEAARYGLARNVLIRRPRIRLRPSGTILTRDVYDAMMERADVEWGFVDRGGDGIAATWRVNPEDALRILRDEIRRIRAGG
jgi:hypothetical protein